MNMKVRWLQMLKYVIAIYLRLSIDDKKVESMSIESQRQLLRKFAADLPIDNIEIVEYVDNGYSGTNFERPAVQELLDDVRAMKINCIIVKDFSRFGRNSIEVGYFTQQVFPLFNVRFISVSDGYDSDDHKGDTGGMEVAFKYLVNEYYSRDLSVKVKSAKHLKMKSGEMKSGIYCYGYKRGENGEMVVDHNVAENVVLIFKMYSEGYSINAIIKELADRQILTPNQYKVQNGKNYDVSNCKRWHRSKILRMLDDEQYLGTFVMGKSTVVDVGCTQMIRKDESEWYKHPNHHEAIISQELFDKVQARRVKKDYKGRVYHQYPLKGKVMCGHCGHTLHRFDHLKPIYKCDYFSKYDKTEPCYDLGILEEELHTVIYDIISKQAEVIFNTSSIGTVSASTLQAEQQIEIQAQLDTYKREKQNLYEKLMGKEITTVEYQVMKKTFDEKIAYAQQQLERCCKQIEENTLAAKTNSEVKKLAKEVLKENTLSQSLADRLIDKVYVYPNKRIEIVWKVQDFCTVQAAI